CLGGCSKDAIAKFFANDAEPGKGDRTSWRLKLQELGGQTLEANNPRLLAATDREKLVLSLIADFRTAIKIRHWLICPIPAELSTPEQEEDLYEVAAVCVDAFRAQHAQEHADDGAGEWRERENLDDDGDAAEQASTKTALTTIDPKALIGPAGKFVKTLAPHTEAPPESLLFQFLPCAGALLGRGPHIMAGGARHGVNLFTVVVGPTASGRKGTARSLVERAVRLADPDFARKNIV